MRKFVHQNVNQPSLDYNYPVGQGFEQGLIHPSVKESVDQTSAACKSLKLLSYNLQVGISCKQYSDYVTQSWRHILPDNQRQIHLSKIAKSLSGFDMVALQEVDSGSLRTNYIDQVAFLAQQSGFPKWYHQKNRKLGRLAAHSNGLLSKHQALKVVRHKLPGRISGRGALQVTLGNQAYPLSVLSVHLSLRASVRRQQFAYISQLLLEQPYFVIMGDMNCRRHEALTEFSKNGLMVKSGRIDEATFPRWDPRYHFDQIWVSKNLPITNYQVMSFGVSDHLPVAIEIEIPKKIGLFKPLATQCIN